MTGPQGLTGAQGPTGETGPRGLTGPRGDQGVIGPQGQTGAQGAQGIQGIQGIKGDSDSVSIADSLEVTAKGQALEASRGKELYDSIYNLKCSRNIQTYTDLSQIGLTDTNTLQEMCNVLPENRR